jgi:single-stranded-DNA-specific exonuclease
MRDEKKRGTMSTEGGSENPSSFSALRSSFDIHPSALRPTPSGKRWIVRQHDEERASGLARSLGVSPIVAQLLIARGHETLESAGRFLHPSHDQLHDPTLMLGMQVAVKRILRAIEAGEKILVYGDYDVDGTTGTVVLRRALSLLGAKTGFHVPHRFTEGYGIQQAALE